MTEHDPQKIERGFWIGTTFVKAQSAELKKERLLLKNIFILTVHRQKATGALFKGNFQVPLAPKETKL